MELSPSAGQIQQETEGISDSKPVPLQGQLYPAYPTPLCPSVLWEFLLKSQRSVLRQFNVDLLFFNLLAAL